MNSVDTIPPKFELLCGDANSCLRIIRNNFPSKYNWLGLAEGAATKAASFITLNKSPLKDGLDWIRVAVELYERMADHPAIINNNDSKRRLLMPAIGLRALAIATWGIDEADTVLSSKEILKRFYSIIEVTPQDLSEDVSFPRNEKIRNALEITRYIEPLENSAALQFQLSDLLDFYRAAKIARKNSQNRVIFNI